MSYAKVALLNFGGGMCATVLIINFVVSTSWMWLPLGLGWALIIAGMLVPRGERY